MVTTFIFHQQTTLLLISAATDNFKTAQTFERWREYWKIVPQQGVAFYLIGILVDIRLYNPSNIAFIIYQWNPRHTDHWDEAASDAVALLTWYFSVHHRWPSKHALNELSACHIYKPMKSSAAAAWAAYQIDVRYWNEICQSHVCVINRLLSVTDWITTNEIQSDWIVLPYQRLEWRQPTRPRLVRLTSE